MKKLMIAAAIVCAAVVGQAAQVSWACDWAYSNDGASINTFDGPGEMIYWVVDMGSSTDTSKLAVDTTGALVNGSNYAIVGEGAFTENGGDFADGEKLANNNYLAMVIYDADNSLWGVSDAAQITGIVDDPPTAGGLVGGIFTNDGSLNPDEAPYMVANQALQAVPEPTSGLLLLLGVAGLALRRRRA